MVSSPGIYIVVRTPPSTIRKDGLSYARLVYESLRSVVSKNKVKHYYFMDTVGVSVKN